MSRAEGLASAIVDAERWFRTTASAFSEEDSDYRPAEGMYTVAQQVEHAADTVDWFMEGAFGSGFDMDFEGINRRIAECRSLNAALEHLGKACASAADRIRGMSDEELTARIEDSPIMNGDPKLAVVSGILDHTAHHRGSLAVYARTMGRVPPMPYS